MFDSPAAPCQMRAFGDKRSLPADRRHKKAQATRPILQQGLSSALTRLRYTMMPPPAPGLSLPIAAGLSIALHLAALITWPQDPGPGGSNSMTRQLNVRLIPSPPTGEATPRPTQRAYVIPTSPSRGRATARTPAPARPAAPPPDADPQPLPVFPVEALTRLPTLLTEIAPDDWPSLPGAPSGRFRIEADIGPDGRVMHVNLLCEQEMREVAAAYAGTIMGWRFTPAEILGHQVSSRIHIEFEIGSPESQGFTATPVPLQAPPRQ